VPLALSVQSAVVEQRWIASQLPVETLAAADALRRVAPPGSGVLSRKMHVAHYSATKAVAFPRVSRLAELAEYCRRNGAQFMYFSWYEAELRPEFWSLLDSTAVVPGLTRIPFPAQHPALLYRIGPDFGRDPDWLADGAQRRLHEARAQVQVLDERDAWSAHLALGEDARARGDQAAALGHFLAVTRGNPALALGWQRAAHALLAAGRVDDARAAYEQARRLAPGDVVTLIGIGWTQARSGHADLAARTWAPLVDQVHDSATLTAMTIVFESAGDPVALAAARRALAALPKR
jgi:tetratricopeptide (TPR) repeat protein